MEKKLDWMTILYAINWFIVCFCCGATRITLVGPFNEIFQDLLEGRWYPDFTKTLFHNLWILWLIPLLWGIVTVALAVSKRSQNKVKLHGLASVLLGGLTYAIYAVSAFLPMAIR